MEFKYRKVISLTGHNLPNGQGLMEDELIHRSVSDWLQDYLNEFGNSLIWSRSEERKGEAYLTPDNISITYTQTIDRHGEKPRPCSVQVELRSFTTPVDDLAQKIDDAIAEKIKQSCDRGDKQ